MPHIHLIEGPVGAGKSTSARALSEQEHAPRLILDQWMTALFAPDRPSTDTLAWYIARKERCVQQIWRVAQDILAAGSGVVLELGLIQRRDRARLYGWVDQTGHTLTVHVLDADREVRRERVRQRNRDKGDTFAVEVPDHFFEMASDRWEAPDEHECGERDVRFLRSDGDDRA